MPTRRGQVALALAAGLYVFARLTAIGELYALSRACLMFPIGAIIFVRLSRDHLSVARAVSPQRIFAGGSLRVSVWVRNNSRTASPPVELEEPAPFELGGSVRSAIPSLRPQATGSFSVERAVARRGRYAIGPLVGQVADPFGLARAVRDVAPATSVIVFPRIEQLAESSPREARGGAGRTLTSRMAVSGDELYAVREWAEGDDLRKIHWRSSARRGHLMIRQDEIRPFPRATLLLDTRAQVHRGDGDASSLEWAVSMAASIVWELSRQGFALRLATGDGGPGAARSGREAADPLLTSLAVVKATGARALLPVLRRVAARPAAGGALIAIMPPPTPDLIAQLARMRRSYAWCGAVLLDAPTFAPSGARERGAFDQRIAESDRSLARAGWRVTVAGSHDKPRSTWQALLARGVSRTSPPLRLL